jgi:hypothetical protein
MAIRMVQDRSYNKRSVGVSGQSGTIRREI